MMDTLWPILTRYGEKQALFFVSMFPFLELKAAIPLGLAQGWSAREVFFLTVIGSMVPVPLVMTLSATLFDRLKKRPFVKKWIEKVEQRTLKKGKWVRMIGLWGLFAFVAVPLPGTGCWSGALLASLLDLPKKEAFIAILGGNTVAGLIVLMITHGFLHFF